MGQRSISPYVGKLRMFYHFSKRETNLSCVGKVFERIVFKYIYNYMLEHKLLYKCQSGFVSGHSTSHQLIELYHKICIALENG